MKINSKFYPVLLALLLFTILINCKKEAVKVVPTVKIAALTNFIAISDISGGDGTYISNQMEISPFFDPFLGASEDSEEDLPEFTISKGLKPEYHNQSELITDYFHVALCRRNLIYFIGGVG